MQRLRYAKINKPIDGSIGSDARKRMKKPARICVDCPTRLNVYNTDIRCHRCDTLATRKKMGFKDSPVNDATR